MYHSYNYDIVIITNYRILCNNKKGEVYLFALSNSILCIILMVLLYVIVVKRIVKEVGGINSGGIILVVIGLGVIGMICSIIGLLGASSINQLITQIPIDKAKNVYIIGIEKYIARQESINIIFIVIGYTTLILEYIIYKILYKKYRQEQEQEQSRTNNHWKLNKLN